MMKSKKLFAGVTAFVMTVMSTAAIAASAADTSVTVEADKITAKAGADYSLNVSLDDVPTTGLNAIEFKITYDADLVSVDSVESGSLAATKSTESEETFASNNANKGEVDVSWTTGLTDSQYAITKDGTFFTIKGKVSDTAKAGDSTPIKIEAIDRESYEGASTKNEDIILASVAENGTATTYTPSTVDGSITIADDTEPTTTTTEAPTTTATTEPVTTVAPTDASTSAATTVTTNGGQTTPTGTMTKAGDVDVNGQVNVADVVLLNKYIVDAAKVSDQGLVNAQCLTDSSTDSKDAAAILAYLAGVVTEIPTTSI